MMQCWVKDPNLRPDFTTIQTELLGMIGQSPTMTVKQRRGDTIQSHSSLSVRDKPPAENTMGSSKDKSKSKASITDNNPEKGLNTVQSTSQDKTGNLIELEINSDSNSKKDNAYANFNCHANTVINVLIVIPTCYSHRDVSKAEAGVYLQLVDNYEPPPHPLLPSMKKHSKKFGGRNIKALNKTEVSKTNSNGYSVPLEYPDLRGPTSDNVKDYYDGQFRMNEGSIPNRENEDT